MLNLLARVELSSPQSDWLLPSSSESKTEAYENLTFDAIALRLRDSDGEWWAKTKRARSVRYLNGRLLPLLWVLSKKDILEIKGIRVCEEEASEPV